MNFPWNFVILQKTYGFSTEVWNLHKKEWIFNIINEWLNNFAAISLKLKNFVESSFKKKLIKT